MKSINSKALSWIAIILSVIAMIITWIRVEVTIANDNFISMIAGFMGVCATLLVGSQIYNSIETSRRIKEIDDKLKETEITLKKVQKEKKEFEHITMHKLYRHMCRSISYNDPFFAYEECFHALKEALYLNNITYVKNALSDIDWIYIKIEKEKVNKLYGKFKYELYSPDKLDKYNLFPLIKDKYQIYYEGIVKLYKQCQKESKTAS